MPQATFYIITIALSDTTIYTYGRFYLLFSGCPVTLRLTVGLKISPTDEAASHLFAPGYAAGTNCGSPVGQLTGDRAIPGQSEVTQRLNPVQIK